MQIQSIKREKSKNGNGGEAQQSPFIFGKIENVFEFTNPLVYHIVLKLKKGKK